MTEEATARPDPEYLRDPAAIYRRSFALVREATDLARFPEALKPVVVRLVHACALPEITERLDWRLDPVAAATTALLAGAPILADARMVASGITASLLPAANRVRVDVNTEAAAAAAKRERTTRSAAAVDFWDEDLAGSVVAIGNAPTALFRLIERIEAGAPKPAAILAFPIGFVGATESKQALADRVPDVPWLTLHGRFGGSALAAAAVNAIAILASGRAQAQ